MLKAFFFCTRNKIAELIIEFIPITIAQEFHKILGVIESSMFEFWSSV
jgi:hypothetical protein